MKKKPLSSKKDLDDPKFKRQLLLGDIEKAFELGDSEIIANSIIDHIVVLSLHQLRINFVYSLMNQYIFDKSIGLCNNMLNLKFVTEKAFEETESEYSNDLLRFDIVRPKIDSWASNKANIVESSPADEQKFKENYNQSTNPGTKPVSFSQLIQGSTKKNNLPTIKSSQAVKSNIRTINEVNDYSESSIKTSINYSILPGNKSKSTSINNDIFTLNNNDSSLTDKKIISSLSRTTTKNFIYNQNNKNNEDEDLPKQFSIIENQFDLEPVDELELVKEKALRIYFKEKDLERERKRRLEKERSSQDSEDESKKKKLFEELNRNTVALDSEGMIINVKTNDMDNVYIVSQPNVKIKDKDKNMDSVRESIKQKEVSREERDLNSKKMNKSNNRFRTKPVTVQKEKVNSNLQNSPKTNVHVISIQNTMLLTAGEDRNYQFHPMEHYDIRPGVTLDFFGAKKTGGKFPKIEVRMSNEEFIEKFNHIGHKTNYLAPNYLEKVDNAKIPRERRKITEKNEENENNSMRMSKIIIGNHDEHSENKLKSLVYENIINPGTFVNSPPTKKNLYEIKKKQRKDKVKSIRNFKFKDLKKIDDDEIREAFNTPEKNYDITDIYEKKKSPRKIYMNIEKEVGYMKKYPRERIAKDILYMTGKVKINSKDKIPKYKNDTKIINNKTKA